MNSTIKIITATFLMMSPYFLVAQENGSAKKKGMSLTAININLISGGFAYSSLTNNDYMDLYNNVEDNTYFITDPENYEQGFFTGFGAGYMPSIMLGFTPRKKGTGEFNFNREFRIKAGANIGARRTFGFNREIRTPYDTLMSSVGRPPVYVDSVYTHDAYYTENMFELTIGLSYLFKTNAEKRWYAYFGIGAEYGFAVQNSVQGWESENYYFTNVDNELYNYGSSAYESNNFTTRSTSTMQFIRAYAPLGVNFRISNNNNFFKHFNLFVEFNPGVEVQMLSGQKTYINPYVGLSFAGIRYAIHYQN